MDQAPSASLSDVWSPQDLGLEPTRPLGTGLQTLIRGREPSRSGPVPVGRIPYPEVWGPLI